jgi:hypothetical protein
MTKAEERGKRKEERKPKNLFSFFRFQILSIHTRVVLADLEPETFPLSSKSEQSNNLQSNNLNLKTKTLISLIILLIYPVDNPVDKLWISCGQGCG